MEIETLTGFTNVVDEGTKSSSSVVVTVTKSVAQRVQKIVTEELEIGERRASRRLQNRPEKKKKNCYYYDSWISSQSNKKRRGGGGGGGKVSNNNSKSSNKKIRIIERSDLSSLEKVKIVEKRDFSSLEKKEKKEEEEEKVKKIGSGDAVVLDCSESVKVGFKEEEEEDESLMNVGLKTSGNNSSDVLGGKSAYAKVKDTLRTFNEHYLHFVQEEEIRCKKDEVKSKTPKASKPKEEEIRCKKDEVKSKTPKASKSKKGKACGDDVKFSAKQPVLKAKGEKGKAKRPDLKAITKMMETNAILYPEKQFGSLPGIDVGHQFYSRAEMVVLGVHSHWLNGIDFMGSDYGKLEKYKGRYTFPLAVSIVMSGVYEDDQDNAEDVIYTGQGGNNLNGNKHQYGDQVMKRGNLALKNSIEQCIPVRVTRGHASSNSYTGKVYTYDGLYKVVQYWAEKGVSGFRVFKYRLKRIEDQPALTTNQVHFVGKQGPKIISELPGLVSEDISGGQEDIPIPATNTVDNPPVAPLGYKYCKSIQVPESLELPPSATGPGCNCRGTCMDPALCACARLNGSDFPYVRKDGGRLIKARSLVYECGPNCGCGPGCVNKTSQRGLKYRFEVFRTPNKGWAVRSWDFIPSGAPVCEYTGLLMRTDDVENVPENNYIFDIDCEQTMRGLDGRERRLEDVAIPSHAHLDETDDKKLESFPEFCINAGPTGNIARFINHSCAPNLFVQCVLSSHHNIKLARVMLFAADNIPPMQELAYDYGYALNSVMGPDGNIKRLDCHCGAADCRKRLY